MLLTYTSIRGIIYTEDKTTTARQGKEEIMKTYSDIMSLISSAHLDMTICNSERKCKICNSSVACWMFAIAKQSFSERGEF